MDNEPSQPAVNQILLNLTRRKDEIRDFLGLLQTLIVKTEKYELNLDQETLTECHQYLTTICKLIVANETEPSFGYELLGSEVDYIFNSLIKIIKEDLQNKDMADFNVVNSLNDLFLKLNLVLKNGSFEFFENNKQLLIKTSLIEEAILPFEELDNYLEVGSVLKDDEETTLFLSEIAKLHTDPGLISPYSAIVGPSFMGKTQVAFTLSHLIHVIYVNFLPVISTRAGSVQPIYRLFERIAQIFQIVIEQDIRSHPSYSISNQEASDIISYDWHSKTLGLLCVLMKMRQLKRNLDIKEWFTDIANIKSIIVPSMTISEFRDKTNGLDYTKHLIFIDELPHINDNTVPMAKAACIKIQFLRNLCRLVKLPANLSGTNSKVNNLIGNGTVAGSRLGERETKPWVQVTVKSTKSSVKSFASLIKYKDHRSVDRSFGRVVSQPGYSVNYPLLISDLYGIQETPSPTNDYLHVGKLIKFIIEQSKTSLSGIIPLIMKKLFQVLPTTSNSKELWRNLWQKVVDDIRIRKPSLNTAEGLLACAHILTMPSVLREVLEIGPYSASLVENHLFYYGTADETTFRLNYMLTGLSANILKLVRVGEDGKISLHEDKCHFPEVEKDFLTTFICMNIWNEAICKVERGESDSAAFTHSYPGSRRCSLASLYQEYLESFKKYRTHSSKTIADSFALEILAFWSICHASHQDFCGETGGVQMFEEFVKNLQCIDSIEGNVTTYAIMKGLEALPTTLSNFLTTRVSVPFLLRYEGESMAHVIHSVSSFIKLGKAYIPDDKIGWDVLFDLEFDGSPAVGFIECKLWARSIGYSTFYKYYKRSCMNGHPLSFLVCKNLQNSIAGPMAVGNLTAMLSEFISYSEEENEAAQINVATEDVIGYEDDSDYGPENESESENQNVTPPKRQKVNYIELFRQLWNDGYHIDIYTVKYDKTDQKFTVAALKTFPTPKGIFILVESTFDPPTRTSSL